ncbi:Poly(A)-specific ribonuclease PARN-like protein, partial [Drosera capensis]
NNAPPPPTTTNRRRRPIRALILPRAAVATTSPSSPPPHRRRKHCPNLFPEKCHHLQLRRHPLTTPPPNQIRRFRHRRPRNYRRHVGAVAQVIRIRPTRCAAPEGEGFGGEVRGRSVRHNFYVFPRKGDGVDGPAYEFLCQTTPIDFLGAQEEEALCRLKSAYDNESKDALDVVKANDVSELSIPDILFTERMKIRFNDWRDGFM